MGTPGHCLRNIFINIHFKVSRDGNQMWDHTVTLRQGKEQRQHWSRTGVRISQDDIEGRSNPQPHPEILLLLRDQKIAFWPAFLGSGRSGPHFPLPLQL